MKKVFLTVLAVALVAVTAVQAQKVNKSALVSKIEKSDADIANEKKAAKAATWLARGKAFYEVAVEPTKSIFANMEPTMLKLAEPKSTTKETLNGTEYDAWVYPYFTAYVKDNKVVTWKQSKWVLKDAPKKAIEAYNKAYELDPKTAEKVKEGLKQVSDFCSQVGNVGIDSGNYVEAADAYVTAFEAQSSPAYEKADPALLYYAGYLLTVDGANNPKSFVKGAEYLTKAIDLGYVDTNAEGVPEGNIYYYLFHCLYGQKDIDRANVMKAKDVLLTGIEKCPKNERILDGLMQLYTSEEGVGNPADLVALIDKAIEDNPGNVDMWFGRGRIFYALKDYDQSIDSFKKVVELKPDLYEGNYYLGLFYTVKADAMNTEMGQKNYRSQSEYDADLKEVNVVYMAALPYFEKAHQLKPDDVDTVDYIKSISFRLRDEPGMMDKYNEYNELLKKMKGLE